MKLRLIMYTMFILSSCNKKTDNDQIIPFQVALKAMDKNFQTESSNLYISQKLSSIEFPDSATVTIVQSDLLDDSISDIKDIFSLSHNNGVWSIKGRTTLRKCRRNKVSDEFSSKLCSMMFIK